MAKFKSHIFSEIRGSVAGTVYSRNRYGAYTRQRVTPVKSTTDRATDAKARFTSTSQNWQELTAAQRIAWTEWARANQVIDSMGQPQSLSGQAAYVGLATRFLIYGFALPTAPPVSPAPAPMTTATVTADKTGGTCNIAFTPALGPGCILLFPCCQVASQGVSYIENLLKGNCSSAPNAPPTPYDAITPVEARIGTLIIGYELHMKLSVISMTTMLMSAPVHIQDTII